MAETMIERVARTIFEAWAKEEGSDATWDEARRMVDLDGYSNAKKWHRMALAEARAAMTAMREPTDEMHLAAVRAYIERDGKCRPSALRDAYTAWIDAALSEGGE